MAKSIEDGFKDIFLAGVGALAITGEKAKEVVDTLIEKGSITVEQGKDINQELQHKATQTCDRSGKFFTFFWRHRLKRLRYCFFANL